MYGFQQLSVGYFPTRDKTQHVMSGTLSVEADCGRKLKRNNFPSQRYCCALIFLSVTHLSCPVIKTFGSISAVEKSGEVAKSVTCVFY